MFAAGDFGQVNAGFLTKLMAQEAIDPMASGPNVLNAEEFVALKIKIPDVPGRARVPAGGGSSAAGKGGPIVPALHAIVTHPRFEGAILVVIVLNTVLLALDRHPLDRASADAYEQLGFGCTLLFGAEMVLSILGLGPRVYFADSFCRFDFTIVVISVVEVVAFPPYWLVGSAPGASSGSGGAISALRTFRLARVLRLMSKYKQLQGMLLTIVRLLPAIANFSALVALFQGQSACRLHLGGDARFR